MLGPLNLAGNLGMGGIDKAIVIVAARKDAKKLLSFQIPQKTNIPRAEHPPMCQ